MNSIVTFIVPVYNASKTLDRCVDSVLQQKNDQWKLLLIDDGSDDQSSLICDDYAKKNEKILSFHKKNGGVANARNFGLSLLESSFVSFLDSDDYLDENFLDYFFSRDCVDCDVFFGNVIQISPQKERITEYTHSSVMVDVKSAISQENILFSGNLHAKIFKTAVIKDYFLKFDENVHWGEDRLFWYKFISKSRNVLLDGRVCYYYERNTQGLSYRMNSFDSEYSYFHSLLLQLKAFAQIFHIDEETVLDMGIGSTSVGMRCLYALVKESDAKVFGKKLDTFSSIEIFFIKKALKSSRMGLVTYPLFCLRSKYLLYWIFRFVLRMKG